MIIVDLAYYASEFQFIDSYMTLKDLKLVTSDLLEIIFNCVCGNKAGVEESKKAVSKCFSQ